MTAAFRRLTIFAACFLTGCGTGDLEQSARDRTQVYVFESFKNPVSTTNATMGGATSQLTAVGTKISIIPRLIPVRECNIPRTYCAEGIAKPVVAVLLNKLTHEAATVSVDVTYDIDRRQTIEARTLTSSSVATDEIDPSVDEIKGHAEFQKTVVLPFGEIRRIKLPNGISVGVCVAKPSRYELSLDGPCNADPYGQNLENAQPL